MLIREKYIKNKNFQPVLFIYYSKSLKSKVSDLLCRYHSNELSKGPESFLLVETINICAKSYSSMK